MRSGGSTLAAPLGTDQDQPGNLAKTGCGKKILTDKTHMALVRGTDKTAATDNEMSITLKFLLPLCKTFTFTLHHAIHRVHIYSKHFLSNNISISPDRLNESQSQRRNLDSDFRNMYH